MKWATPSLSQARGDRTQAWVRAWARTPSSTSGRAARTGVASMAPVSKGMSPESGSSRIVSWERGRTPSQLCRNGVTSAAAAVQALRASGSESGLSHRVVLVAGWLVRLARKRLGASKPRVESSTRAVAMAATVESGAAETASGMGWPLTRATAGDWPDGVSTVRARRKCAPVRRSLWLPISSKRRAPSPRMTGIDETGYQTTLPKPRRPVKSGAMRSQSDCSAISSGVPIACRRLAESGDDAGVGNVELEGCAGGERGGQRDSCFVELAGVVGV